MSNLGNASEDLMYASSWIEKNESSLSVLLKRRPEIRSSWLDGFIRSTLSDFSEHEDQAKYDRHVAKLFVLVRELQKKLNLRLDSDSYYLNSFTPLVRQLKDQSSEVLPGSFSGTRQHLEFKLGVFKEIERRHPVVLDSRGFAIDSGYGHDVSRLLSLTGFTPSKIGVRALSNLDQRVEHGLSNKIGEDFLNMVDDFLLLLYGMCTSKSIRLEAKSQSGLPMRVYGRGYKTITFENAVVNLDDVLKHSANPRYLLDRYDILFAFLQGSRQSADSAGKRRFITSLEDNAVGLAGNTLQDNRPNLPHIPAALRKHFVTMRYRFVWGGNSVSNSIVNTIGTSCRNTYGKTYEFTFKHRGREDLLSKIKTFYGKDELSDLHKSECDLVVIDVTSFDLDYPRDILRKYIDFFADSPIYDFFFRTAFAPSIQGTLDKDSFVDEPILSGDPFEFDPMDFIDSGLPSGWSWVSDAGKIMALNIYFCLVKANLLSAHSIEQLHNFLKGKEKFGCLNLGDDNVILCPPGSFDLVMDALNKHSAWLVDLEPGARFIGFPLFFDSFGNFRITHDPASYVTNWLTPERGINGKFTKYWAYGLEQRERVYSDAPIIHSFRKIIMDKWKEVYGSDLNAIIKNESKKQMALLANDTRDDELISILYQRLADSPDISLATSIINDVIRDSSVLQWKWDSDDILRAFGLRIEELESRPHVRFSEKVLERSGYKRILDPKEASAYEGGLYFHSRLLADDRRDFFMQILKENEVSLENFDLESLSDIIRGVE